MNPALHYFLAGACSSAAITYAGRGDIWLAVLGLPLIAWNFWLARRASQPGVKLP